MKRKIAQQFSSGIHRPSAALIRYDMRPRMHVRDTQSLDLSMDFGDLRDALLCVGLVGPVGPYALASWADPPEWMPIALGQYGISLLEGMFQSYEWQDGACHQAQMLYAAFSQLDDNQKVLMRLRMQYLNSAMRRVTLVDAAIHLGIVFESLFLNDLESNRGELSFRLRMRAARLLGMDQEDRVRLSTIFNDLYRVRSIAVHTGHLSYSDKIRSIPIRELIQKGFELASEAIKHFLLEGEPDWNQILFS